MMIVNPLIVTGLEPTNVSAVRHSRKVEDPENPLFMRFPGHWGINPGDFHSLLSLH
jgi:hypothetical protein